MPGLASKPVCRRAVFEPRMAAGEAEERLRRWQAAALALAELARESR